MKKIFVRDLKPDEPVDSVFILGDRKVLPTRTGKHYLSLRLRDRTGSVSAKIWDNGNIKFAEVPSEGPVRVVGRVEVFENALQVIIERIHSVPIDQINPRDFVPSLEHEEIERLKKMIRAFYKKLKCRHCMALWKVFLGDEELQKKFVRAPGAVKVHHSYLGGLLEHTVGVLRLVDSLCGIFRELNRDIILTGALLHDIGKVREYSYDLELGFTDEGRLLGHIVIGLQILDDLLKKVKSFPEDKVLVLRHLIASHHGQLEFGSPRVPMTREALVLHYADNLDARLNELNRLYDETEKEVGWTAYQQRYGTQFYVASDLQESLASQEEAEKGYSSSQLSLDAVLRKRQTSGT